MRKYCLVLVAVLLISWSIPSSAAARKEGRKSRSVVKQAVVVDKDHLSFAAPAIPATQGVDSLNAYTPWGGMGISEAAEYEMIMARMNVIGALYSRGVISEDVAKQKPLEAYDQLEDATRPNRFLGFLWKTRGKNLSNLMGLLSWPSFRGE